MTGMAGSRSLLLASAIATASFPISISADQRPSLPGEAGSPRRVADTSSGVVALAAAPEGNVLVRGGTFQRGSDVDEIHRAMMSCVSEPSGNACSQDWFVYEFAENPVTVSDFMIDRLEVRVGDYQRCVEVGPCRARPLALGGQRFVEPDLPATMVTHSDAATYCGYRGGRLPTEAEWEYAARGGAKERRFPWGNVFDPYFANGGRFAQGVDPYETKDGFLELAPVGSFAAGRTPDGLFDMAGNAEEWVADWFAEYPQSTVSDPKGPDTGDERVVRGGSYAHGKPWLRSAARGHAFPGSRAAFRGFRCAYDAP